MLRAANERMQRCSAPCRSFARTGRHAAVSLSHLIPCGTFTSPVSSCIGSLFGAFHCSFCLLGMAKIIDIKAREILGKQDTHTERQIPQSIPMGMMPFFSVFLMMCCD